MLSDDQREVINAILDDIEYGEDNETNVSHDNFVELLASIKERLEVVQGFDTIPSYPARYFASASEKPSV